MRSARWYDYLIILFVYDFLVPVKLILSQGIVWGWGLEYFYEWPIDFFLHPFIVFLIWWVIARRWE